MTGKLSNLQQLKESEREARRQLILSATLSLFGKNQIADVSMRDIAKEAGVSPALIYRHFNNRDELFVESFIVKSKEMIDSFEKKLTKSDVLTIEEIGSQFIHFLIDNPLFFKMMSYFMLDYTLREEHLERFNETIRELLELFDKGFYENGLTEDVRLYSHAFFSALNGIMITFHHYPGRSEKEIQQHIKRLTELISNLFTSAKAK
ncbi:MAG TPA: TetR/AcrR family transcriptional regulator [Pseudogracilibacillus sp.]|nr:TetR/AcrR family transcriptional regulator [Pseudogracilibacillus sp.]